MVAEIQKYQKKWHNHVERMPPERLPWQNILLSSCWKMEHLVFQKEMETTIPLASEQVNGLNP
jgi:hypothetical protein